MTEPEETSSPGEPGESGPAGESDGMSERTARLVLTTVLLLAIWGIVAAVPEAAYVVVGVLLCLGWQRTTAWLARRRQTDDGQEPDDEDHGEAVVEVLHQLADPHVFLADFATATGLSKDEARGALEALHLPVRRAVRNGTRTGVGVHRDDLPPLPPHSSPAPVDGVDQGQPTNQQSVRIKRTDGGVVLYDLADVHRHHRLDDH
ncbi:hypothetical protein ACF09J_13865 [Streptomyces sp. NPDC014889]|uniref:hypothetical protein n=1 Tax=Streptomyces sp. NPDC014889 TaxID=3364928 RepID=UPI003702E34F